jgi:hypothetical protein
LEGGGIVSNEPERKEEPGAWIIYADSSPDDRACPIGLCDGSGVVYTYPEPMGATGSTEAMACACASGGST